MDSKRVIGRFAPSPTGPLHLGSLVAAVGSFLFARAENGTWLVRMEDLDTPRVVPGSADEILRTLERYQLHWDGAVLAQSTRLPVYDAVLDDLRHRSLTFDCACSRAEMRRAASAPSDRDEVDPSGPVYPGTCRLGMPPGRVARAIRFRVPHTTIRFNDLVAGRVEENVAFKTGDFVVKRADGLHAYQLAVVVDDVAQKVNQVIRGGDLLSSTARQIALVDALGEDRPSYGHLPLVVNRNGEKIGKRDGALPLPTLDEEGVTESLLWALAVLGIRGVDRDTPDRMLARAVSEFDPGAIPRGAIGLTTRTHPTGTPT